MLPVRPDTAYVVLSRTRGGRWVLVADYEGDHPLSLLLRADAEELARVLAGTAGAPVRVLEISVPPAASITLQGEPEPEELAEWEAAVRERNALPPARLLGYLLVTPWTRGAWRVITDGPDLCLLTEPEDAARCVADLRAENPRACSLEVLDRCETPRPRKLPAHYA